MVIGFLKCTEEDLVALVPKVIPKFVKNNWEVWIENGAGLTANYDDKEYANAGAKLVSRDEIYEADVIVTVSGIDVDEISKFNPNACLVGKFNARNESNLVSSLKESGINTFSLDLLPRSTIAQSMDVLSSLASLSGYKAVLVGANNFGGYLPMMTTSAGTIPPAKIMILGAGVAGLQAIATAKRLGAMVDAFDVRSAVKEEVESLGAKFIEVEGAKDDKDAGGYAIEQTDNYKVKQKELIHETALKADIIITTANIPGRQAPLLIEKRTVEAMKPGSVIIDMASASGGNVEVSKDNQMVEHARVKVIGDSKLYNQMGSQASFVFSNNIFNFLSFVMKEGFDKIPFDNEIVSSTLLAAERAEAVLD